MAYFGKYSQLKDDHLLVEWAPCLYLNLSAISFGYYRAFWKVKTMAISLAIMPKDFLIFFLKKKDFLILYSSLIKVMFF